MNNQIKNIEQVLLNDKENEYNCTGCGCCMNLCPVNAIKMQYNEKGYLIPFIDEVKCIYCGRCTVACPVLQSKKVDSSSKSPACFAIWAQDKIRMKSSSGGFFTVLAEYFIKKGGYVYGAVWKEDFSCEIIEASCKEQIDPMRTSKYVQSRTAKTYQQVARRLRQEKMVVYTGCPCQIAGLNSFLESERICDMEREHLITVDLVCFYTPSNKYFQKYLDEEYGIENVSKVNFRDKAYRGWNTGSYCIELKNGKKYYPDSSVDPYQKGFYSLLARRKTCEKCRYYDFPREGDFTIGDFWGIDRHDISWMDNKGTSVVIANSERAKRLFEKLKPFFKRWEEVPLSWCLDKGNRIGSEVRYEHPNKGYFEFLVQRKSFREAVERAMDGTYEIGCVCLFNYNIGNNLTNYALYRVLTDLGYTVLMIGNPKIGESISSECYEDRFRRFQTNPYHDWDISPLVCSKEELYDLNKKCDIFIVASDQLWRSGFLELMNHYPSLDWVASKKNKISYATSFGTEQFEGDESCYKRLGYFLKRFQNISVREESGRRIVRDLANQRAEVVLDPVFLCDRQVYNDMADEGRVNLPKSKYVGAYFLDKTVKKETLLIDLSKEKTEGVYQAITDFSLELQEETLIDYMADPSVEEWLAMIRECEFFLTDSFHGICFALIFEKPFAVIFNKENWRGFTRIKETLEKFGLWERYLNGEIEELLNISECVINYARVCEVIDRERDYSLKWLKTAIGEGKEYNGEFEIFDLILEKEKKLYDFECKLQAKEKKLEKKLLKMKMEQLLEKRLVGCEYEGVLRKKGDGGKMTVIGFGAGECFRRNIDKIRQVMEMRFVCDNDLRKWDSEIADGIICISPKKLKEIDNVLVIIMIDDVGTSFEIAGQLIEMGIFSFTHISNWLKEIEDN